MRPQPRLVSGFQFSVEEGKDRQIFDAEISGRPSTIRARRFRAGWMPNSRGRPAGFAQRPFPSMMTRNMARALGQLGVCLFGPQQASMYPYRAAGRARNRRQRAP